MRTGVSRLLSGERTREFVFSRQQEAIDLGSLPATLYDDGVSAPEMGLRIGEGLRLEWADMILQPVNGARFPFVRYAS